MNLGRYERLVREVARYDVDAAERIASWPVREVLIAHLARQQEAAIEAYREGAALWAALAPHMKKAPAAPRSPKIEDPE